MKTKINLKINKYRLDISKENEAKQYEDIKAICKELKYKLFDVINPTKHYLKDLPLEGLVDTEFLFENQYSLENHRIHDWYEAIYPNKSIKEGYYLTGDIEKLNEFKAAHYACGYCGARYQGHDAPIFCNKCLDSEYLKEDQLKLLVLQPIKGKKRNFKENDELLKAYKHAQDKTTQDYMTKHKARFDEKAKQLQIDCNKKIESLAYETACQIEVLKNGIDIDNLIYYSHKNQWVFGWNKPLTDNEKEKLSKTDLSFKYIIK